MDTFKIIVIIFLILLTYQIYQLNCTVYKDRVEGFEGATQNLGGVDDANAINTLAQIARKLMDGTLTVPGNMTVKGGSIATGNAPGQTPGTIISNMGDSWGMLWGENCALIGQKGKLMRFGFADAYSAAGWDEKMNIQPDGVTNIKGTLNVAGRNILAELDKLNSRWKGDDLVVNSINAAGNLNGPNYSIDTAGLIKVNKMKFGKFLISGVGDYAANDTTIRPVLWDNQSRMADFASNTVWRAARPDGTFL